MEILIALIAIISILIVYWLRSQLTYWRRRGIPHDAPDFLMGNAKGWRTTKHIKDIFEPVYKKYKGHGPFAGFYLLFRPVALATDIEFVKNVLIKDFSYFEDRGVFHNERDDPLTGHLFAIEGQKWRNLRQKLSSTFTSGKMKFMFPTVLEIGQNLTKVFGNKVVESPTGDLEITDLVSRYTADVIGSCAFGLECNSLKNPDAEFVVMGRRAITEKRHNQVIDGLIDTFPEIARFLRMRQINQDSHDFYMKIVKDTVDYREKNKIQRSDFMNMLIELKNGEAGLTFNELAAQAFVFFLAGFETSSTTMGFALYELAKNPAVQEKLREHINEILVKYKNEFTYECMQDMKYLDQVISETLRKYPIVPNLIRKTKSLYQTSDPKFYLEPDTLVIISAYLIQHDPEYFPEPERFDPLRFEDEEIKKRPACTWLPFGDGPRNCIGLRFGKMQTAIGLAYLVQNFKFSICARTPDKIQFDNKNIIINAVGGIHLRVEKV